MKAVTAAIAVIAFALTFAGSVSSANAQVARSTMRAQTESITEAVQNQARQAAQPHLSGREAPRSSESPSAHEKVASDKTPASTVEAAR